MSAKTIDFRFIEWWEKPPAKRDVFLEETWTNLRGNGERVVRVDAISDQVKQKCLSAGATIGRLEIIGHGRPGYLAAGETHQPYDPTQLPKKQPTRWIDCGERGLWYLKHLKAKRLWTAASELRLLGCNVAHAPFTNRDDDGPGAIMHMAKTLGCRVIGVKSTIKPEHFFEGGLKPDAKVILVTADPSSCEPSGTIDGDERSEAPLDDGALLGVFTALEHIEEMEIRRDQSQAHMSGTEALDLVKSFDYSKAFKRPVEALAPQYHVRFRSTWPDGQLEISGAVYVGGSLSRPVLSLRLPRRNFDFEAQPGYDSVPLSILDALSPVLAG